MTERSTSDIPAASAGNLTNGVAGDPKRNKACEHCRSLKVRCITNPDDPSQPCVRCKKTKRECVFHIGPRKRTRKADKVAALEKKLEYLTNALQKKEEVASLTGTISPEDHEPQSANGYPPTQQLPQEHHLPQPLHQPSLQKLSESPISNGGTPMSSRPSFYNLRTGDAKHPSLNGTPEEFVASKTRTFESGFDSEKTRESMLAIWNKLAEKSALRLHLLDSMPVSKTPRYGSDVVSRGVISVEEAEERFKLYRKITSVFPMVDIDDDMTVDRLRHELPALFLCIMSAASLVMEDASGAETSMILYNFACETVIYETMMVGSKTFELLQCLVLLTFWYNEPELYHHQKSHLLANLAISIAVDLGINGGTAPIKTMSRYESIVRPQALVDPRTLECKKMWLSVYCSALNLSLVVRRPMYALWSPYTDECCTIIETHPDLGSAEKQVAIFARMSKVFEDISQAFQSDRHANPTDMHDPKTKYLVAHFENQLANLFDTVTDPAVRTRLEPYAHAIKIYLHQSVFYVPFDNSIGRSPFSEFSLAVGQLKCTPETISSTLQCYASSLSYIESFLQQDPNIQPIMPLFSYTRLVFVGSTLLKLRALYLTNTEFARTVTIEPSSLDRLQALQDRLKEITDQYPFCNSAPTFDFVLKLLLLHHDRQLACYFERGEKQVAAAELAAASKKQSSTYGHAERKQYLEKPMQAEQYQQHPGSPLEILSSVAEAQTPTCCMSMPLNQAPAPGQASIGMNGVIPQNPVTVCARQGMPGVYPQTDVAQPQQPMNGDNDSEYPYWLMGEDFWKDLVPNVEAFTGYDVM